MLYNTSLFLRLSEPLFCLHTVLSNVMAEEEGRTSGCIESIVASNDTPK